MFQSRTAELEQYILGLALSRHGVAESMTKKLTPAHFTVEAHQHIFTSMINSLEKGDMVDLITVATQLFLNNKVGKRIIKSGNEK